MTLETIAREGVLQDGNKRLAERIGNVLETITKDIYSLPIHPIKVTKKYIKGYLDMFRGYQKKLTKD
jgi:hypothetical protein